MPRMRATAGWVVRLAGLAVVASCATPSGSERAATTDALRVVGARCAGGACSCRQPGDQRDEGPVTPGEKRFEVRLGRGLDPARVSIERHGTLVKVLDKPDEQCAYLDLAPGLYGVHLHVAAANPEAGMFPALELSEHGADTQSWYDTFRFHCGVSEPCTKADLAAWLDEMRAHKGGITDLCGSVRVEGARWGAEHSPGARVEELDVEFVLHVYPFAPRFPHGSSECKPKSRERGGGGGGGGDESGAQ
jgi:hypothetical protein